MSKIIAEIENTLSGTILVVKNENGTFSMGPLDENGVFSEKHINMSNTESVVNAMAFYFQAEANSRQKMANKQ